MKMKVRCFGFLCSTSYCSQNRTLFIHKLSHPQPQYEGRQRGSGFGITTNHGHHHGGFV